MSDMPAVLLNYNSTETLPRGLAPSAVAIVSPEAGCCYRTSASTSEEGSKQRVHRKVVRSKHHRRLSFQESPMPDILEDRVVDPEDIWWSLDEIAAIQRESKTTASLNKHIRNSIHTVMKSYRSDSPDTSEEVAEVAACEARGLESRIAPTIKLHRIRHLETVLNVQRRLKGRISDDVLASLLRDRSLQASRCGRQLAVQIARGDQAEALKVYEEQEDIQGS